MLKVHTTLLLVLAVVVAGCGFHLRGETALPAAYQRVEVKGPKSLTTVLTLYLTSGGTEVVQSGADAVLRIDEERYDRRVLSVDPATGKEREFELAYLVTFSATSPDGTLLLESQSLNLLRDFIFDTDAVIGASREEGVLRDEMRKDAAQRILRRLSIALRRTS